MQHKGCSRQGLQRMYAEPYAPAYTLRYLDRDLRAVLSNRELISAWLGEEVIHLLLVIVLLLCWDLGKPALVISCRKIGLFFRRLYGNNRWSDLRCVSAGSGGDDVKLEAAGRCLLLCMRRGRVNERDWMFAAVCRMGAVSTTIWATA